VVEIAAGSRHDQFFPLIQRVVERWGTESNSRCLLNNQSNILQLPLGPTACYEVSAHHAISVEIENAAVSKST
jgi:hypothetical protein